MAEPIYDENKVPEYVLPDPLILESGEPVTTPSAWRSTRRKEILQLFGEHVYGHTPREPTRLVPKVESTEDGALGGRATRKQVTLSVSVGERDLAIHVLVYLPGERPERVPVFLALNGHGNVMVNPDPGITMYDEWTWGGRDMRVVNDRPTEQSRGRAAFRWPIKSILARGYGLVTAYCGDSAPDHDHGFTNGVHPLFYRPGQERPEANEWASLGAWAWQLSRIMDYLQSDPDVDHERVVLLGHSRLGKAALWASAQDERFSLAISNSSGCGGAALSRRCFGETVESINKQFPHWFCGNFKKHNANENSLPVDQHMLIALSAPRPVLVCSASKDMWADPVGEFLSAKHASPVYRLCGTDGLAVEKRPRIGKLVRSTIGYHMRWGRHTMNSWDWRAFLAFADEHLDMEK